MMLVTGGTGFVGSELIGLLVKEGGLVRCLSRNPSSKGRLEKGGLEYKRGDIRDIDSVLDAVHGEIDAVINLVGILAEGRGEGFRDVHVRGVENLVEACLKKGIKRLIHISALGTRPHAVSLYHRTKWEAEEIIRKSGIEYTIFRPSVMFGEKDRFTNLFAKLMKISPFIAVPGSGKNLMQPLYVKDLARMINLSVKRKEATGKTYEVGGAQKLSFDEIIDAVAEALGKKIFKFHVPILFMKPAAAICEMTFKKPPLSLSRDTLIMLQEDNVTDERSIETEFNIKPVGFREGIKTYLH